MVQVFIVTYLSFREVKPGVRGAYGLYTAEAVLKVQLQRRVGKNHVWSNWQSRVGLALVRLHNTASIKLILVLLHGPNWRAFVLWDCYEIVFFSFLAASIPLIFILTPRPKFHSQGSTGSQTDRYRLTVSSSRTCTTKTERHMTRAVEPRVAGSSKYGGSTSTQRVVVICQSMPWVRFCSWWQLEQQVLWMSCFLFWGFLVHVEKHTRTSFCLSLHGRMMQQKRNGDSFHTLQISAVIFTGKTNSVDSQQKNI